MKKLLLLLTAAVTVFTACEKDEVEALNDQLIALEQKSDLNDAALQDAIQAGIEALTQAIEDEAAIRAAGDANLADLLANSIAMVQELINQEEAARVLGDQQITEALAAQRAYLLDLLDQERLARVAGDENLQQALSSAVAVLTHSIAVEVAERTEADRVIGLTLEAHEGLIADNAAAIAVNAEAIAANATDIASNTLEIIANTDDISQNDSDINANGDAIQANLVAIQDNLVAIQANADTISSTIADLNALSASLDAAIESLNAADSDLADSLNQLASSIEADINELTASYNTIAADLADLESRFNGALVGIDEWVYSEFTGTVPADVIVEGAWSPDTAASDVATITQSRVVTTTTPAYDETRTATLVINGLADVPAPAQESLTRTVEAVVVSVITETQEIANPDYVSYTATFDSTSAAWNTGGTGITVSYAVTTNVPLSNYVVLFTDSAGSSFYGTGASYSYTEGSFVAGDVVFQLYDIYAAGTPAVRSSWGAIGDSVTINVAAYVDPTPAPATPDVTGVEFLGNNSSGYWFMKAGLNDSITNLGGAAYYYTIASVASGTSAVFTVIGNSGSGGLRVLFDLASGETDPLFSRNDDTITITKGDAVPAPAAFSTTGVVNGNGNGNVLYIRDVNSADIDNIAAAGSDARYTITRGSQTGVYSYSSHNPRIITFTRISGDLLIFTGSTTPVTITRN